MRDGIAVAGWCVVAIPAALLVPHVFNLKPVASMITGFVIGLVCAYAAIAWYSMGNDR